MAAPKQRLASDQLGPRPKSLEIYFACYFDLMRLRALPATYKTRYLCEYRANLRENAASPGPLQSDFSPGAHLCLNPLPPQTNSHTLPFMSTIVGNYCESVVNIRKHVRIFEHCAHFALKPNGLLHTVISFSSK